MTPEPLEVYVETSVWSYVLADDKPQWRDLTLKFFDTCRERRIEPVISPTVIVEINRSDADTRERLS